MWKAIFGSDIKTAAGMFGALILGPRMGDPETAKAVTDVGVALASVGVVHKSVKYLIGVFKASKAKPVQP